MKIKTLKAFSGPDGRHAKDVIIDVPAARADWLADNGFAERVDGPVKAGPKKAAPKAAKSPSKKPAPQAAPANPTE